MRFQAETNYQKVIYLILRFHSTIFLSVKNLLNIFYIILGEAPGMPKIRKSCFTTKRIHASGDRVGNYWMGEVRNIVFSH